jgi:hypothetical protein
MRENAFIHVDIAKEPALDRVLVVAADQLFNLPCISWSVKRSPHAKANVLTVEIPLPFFELNTVKP